MKPRKRFYFIKKGTRSVPHQYQRGLSLGGAASRPGDPLGVRAGGGGACRSGRCNSLPRPGGSVTMERCGSCGRRYGVVGAEK